MTRRRVFLAAYICSGGAGLIYQVTWARLLGLYLGHSTAAASSVLAAFMIGLSGGAIIGGRMADRLSPRRALHAYAVLELIVLISAAMIPLALATVAPVLSGVYNDGAPGVLFAVFRLLLCSGLLIIPTLALGATFPVAVQWFRRSGALYAANTVGAAIGAIVAGFVLLPRLGHTGTILVGAVLTGVSALAAVVLARRETGEIASSTDEIDDRRVSKARPALRTERAARRTKRASRISHPTHLPHPTHPDMVGFWLPTMILGITGFATFLFEIVWMRLFALLIGPSTYAFAATVSAFIAALAVGSVFGAALGARVRRPTISLALALTWSAVAFLAASSYAGTILPGRIADDLGSGDLTFGNALFRQSLIIGSVIFPGTIGLGAAFPLALEVISRHPLSMMRRLGTAYGVNALASVAGSLAAGFLTIPLVGLQQTIGIGAALLLAGATAIVLRRGVSLFDRSLTLAAIVAGFAMIVFVGPWDHEILAGGPYTLRQLNSYLRNSAASSSLLRAGALVYYQEGAIATVSVKRLNGALSLAIDGKVDASTSYDMLTQKMLAHLPLLLHPHPKTVGIIGLGSGVTLASTLVHPVDRVDVVELSPEVVEASRLFSEVNRNALADARAHLIVGDGRTHLLLAKRVYDVIVSEPSNPWMAGVASLFTREFFEAARDRLAAGGILCQWAHTYNMSDADLRSIVATFASVFPYGTMWLVGNGDLLLIGSHDTEPDLAGIEREWNRPGVAADLAEVGAVEPFTLISMLIGGPKHMQTYGAGAGIQSDDRMQLEFSGPAALFTKTGMDNTSALLQVRNQTTPSQLTKAITAAGAAQWRHRGKMMLDAGSHDTAQQDFSRALAIDPTDGQALEGVVDAALRTQETASAATLLKQIVNERPDSSLPWIALSRLFAASGDLPQAFQAAAMAGRLAPAAPESLDQLASLYTDSGDAKHLSEIAGELSRLFPNRPSAAYYGAASEFMFDRLDSALTLVDRAITLQADYAEAHNLRGAILARLGQTENARDAFRTSLRLKPRDSTTYQNFGLLELAAGNREAAGEWFSEALALDPTSEASQQGLTQATE